MPLDAVVLSALSSEMEDILTGARIDKITMPEKDLVILSVHGTQGNRKLLHHTSLHVPFQGGEVL